ncbi:MAG: hypothetical protein ACYTGB_15435 [Planctomycetota bacterium]|jgi:hypothetical protein
MAPPYDYSQFGYISDADVANAIRGHFNTYSWMSPYLSSIGRADLVGTPEGLRFVAENYRPLPQEIQRIIDHDFNIGLYDYRQQQAAAAAQAPPAPQPGTSTQGPQASAPVQPADVAGPRASFGIPASYLGSQGSFTPQAIGTPQAVQQATPAMDVRTQEAQGTNPQRITGSPGTGAGQFVDRLVAARTGKV